MQYAIVNKNFVDKRRMLCYTFLHKKSIFLNHYGGLMRLNEELYFEFTAEGSKTDVERFISYVCSGVLDDYFEISEDMITYSDNFDDNMPGEPVSATVSNDDYGIEISSLNPESVLEVICAGGAPVFIHGHLYDIDDEDYAFISHEGDSSFVNVEDIEYKDELDIEAYKEELDERDNY